MKIFTFFSLSSKTHILSIENHSLTPKLSLHQNSLSLSLSLESYRKSEKREGGDVATDDDDGGKSFPERRERVVSTAIVTKHSTHFLNLVHQSNQTLHRRHIFTAKSKSKQRIQKAREFQSQLELRKTNFR